MAKITDAMQYAHSGLRDLRDSRKEYHAEGIQRILVGLKVACDRIKKDRLPKTAILDGKEIFYTRETVFLVQIGHGPKGAYRTKYRFTGNLHQALGYYNGINIGNGFKKRLVMVGQKSPLARCSS